MSEPPTSEDSPKSTCSLESEDGATPCGSPNGQTTNRSGQGHVHVSRFRSRGSAEVTSTSAISGQLFTGSSPSTALQSSLENKLRQAMDLNGSLEFVLTWKDDGYAFGASNLSRCKRRRAA